MIQDGQPRPDGRVLLDVEDQGLARGLSVFETMRTWSGRLRLIALHLDRLADSARALRIPMPPRPTLEREAEQAARAIPGEAVVRITLTERTRIVHAGPMPIPPPGVRVALRPHPEHPWLSGRVKHSSRAASVTAVRDAGTDEVLWTDASGALLEGTYTNVFAVQQGVLLTPADDGRILAGVTRRLVLAAAAQLYLPHGEGALPAHGPFDELYLTSSLKLLVPVVELDGRPAPGTGPVGQRLVAAVRARLEVPEEPLRPA